MGITNKELDDVILGRPTPETCFPSAGTYVIDKAGALIPEIVTVYFDVPSFEYKVVAPSYSHGPVALTKEFCDDLKSVRAITPRGIETTFVDEEHEQEVRKAEEVVKRHTLFDHVASLFWRIAPIK